ncbi:DUF6069 family protein, partial [Nocardioides hankookensis]
MSTTYSPSTSTSTSTSHATGRRTVWRHGLAASVVAAVVTTTLAAISSAAGVSFTDSSGESIPLAGFTQLTLVFSLVGVGL